LQRRSRKYGLSRSFTAFPSRGLLFPSLVPYTVWPQNLLLAPACVPGRPCCMVILSPTAPCMPFTASLATPCFDYADCLWSAIGSGVCTECEWRNVESSSLNLPASCLPTPKPTCLNLIGRGAVLLCKQPTYGENCRPQCLPVYPGARGELVKHVSVVLRFPRSKSCCIPYLKPCCVSIRRANELANTPVPLERGRVQGLNVSGRLRDESRRCCDDIHGSAVTHTLPNLGGYRK